MKKVLTLIALLLAAVACGADQAALAQTYPARTITLVVPFPPGGGVDALARIVAEKLSVALKHTVVVDNRAGAGGNLGTRAVAKAEPDGYTLLLGHTGTISIGWPRIGRIRSAMMRAAVSVDPPGGNGTISVIWREG